MARKQTPAPALVQARVQANVGEWRVGQVVEVYADDPLLGHYLRAVDPPEPGPLPPEQVAALLGVAPAEDGDDAEPG